MKRVIVAGSTGSVGTQTLEVIAAHPELFELVGLAAGTQAELLASQVSAFGGVESALGLGDTEALVRAVDADVVVNAITGSRGLGISLATIESNRTLALANKESLVVGGELLTRTARRGQIVPVDSEHAAIAQALRSGRADEVSRLILTASGGPFRGRSKEQLRAATPAEALAHPTWTMGRTVTTNSATLLNKGLELIEAHHLFGVTIDEIEVVIHPQSVVHSMVEFVDGSTIAQAARPDLRLAIASALDWPRHVPGAVAPLDWSESSAWQFEPVDDEAFPAIVLAREAGRRGGTVPAAMNAANEIAVDAFHRREIGFLDIVEIVERVVDDHQPHPELTVETIADAEATARMWARVAVDRIVDRA